MKLLSIFFILICGLSVFCQNPEQSPKSIKNLQLQVKTLKYSKRYDIAYKVVDDKTNVRFLGLELDGFGESLVLGIINDKPRGRNLNVQSVLIGAGFKFQGDTLKESPSNYFIYFFYRGRLGQISKNVKLIVFTKDSAGNKETIEFGKGEEQSGYLSDSDERIVFKATKEELVKLSQSKNAAIKLGVVIQPIFTEHLQMFADILKLGDLSQK